MQTWRRPDCVACGVTKEQWKPLLEALSDRMMLIESGLESAQDKARASLGREDGLKPGQVDVVSHSPAAPAWWILMSLLVLTLLMLFFIGIYCMVSLTLTARQVLCVACSCLARRCAEKFFFLFCGH